MRILTRREHRHPAWTDLPYQIVHGSLEDEFALTELLRNAQLVVHAAGLIKARDRSEFLRVNRDGTARLAGRTRARAPEARFLLVSSLAAREPQLSDYAFSKRQAELAAEAAFAAAPGRLAIIRPPVIYGPWDKATLGIFKAARLPFTLVPGRGRTAMIHAGDAAAAIAAVATDWRPGQFALADRRPEGYGMRKLLQTAAQATGGTPRLVQVPDAVVLAAGRGAGLWSQLTGKAHIFGPGKAREILHANWGVSSAELLPTAIFKPRFDLQEGFADTVAWYRQKGWL